MIGLFLQPVFSGILYPFQNFGKGPCVIRKITLGIASLAFALVVGCELGSANAYAAAKKVDCGKVTSELGSGKKAKDVAKDLSISTSSVYRCKKKMAGAKSMGSSSASAGSVSSTAPATHKK
jgi:hypothetical protein